MKEKKIDMEGRVIVKKKLQPVKEETTGEITVIDDAGEDFESAQNAPEKRPHVTQIADYDFVIKCTTMAEIGVDMRLVCSKCPYKVSACMDTHLIPTETQKKDISKILRMAQVSGDGE